MSKPKEFEAWPLVEGKGYGKHNSQVIQDAVDAAAAAALEYGIPMTFMERELGKHAMISVKHLQELFEADQRGEEVVVRLGRPLVHDTGRGTMTIDEQVRAMLRAVYHLQQSSLPADEYEIGDRGESLGLAEKAANEVDLNQVGEHLKAVYAELGVEFEMPEYYQ